MTFHRTPFDFPARSYASPHEDAYVEELRAIRREQEMEADEPSGAIGWVVTGLCVAIMGFAISAQALWEVAL